MSGKPARVPLTNPFLWLLNRRELTARLMWGFSILTVVLGMIGGLLLRRTGVGAFVAMTFFTLYGLHVTWKLFVVSDALRRLHLDHRSGALELLLSTPLEPEEIIASQLKRIQRVFLPGAAALAVANALVFSDRNLNDLPVLPIGGALILLLDGRAMTWMAMLEAFRPGRYLAGIFRVAGIIMVPPMVTMILTITAKRGFTSEEANAIFFFYFIGCAIYDLALLKRAKSRLIKQFRMLAAEGQPREAAVGSTLPKPLQWLLLAEPSPSAARAQ